MVIKDDVMNELKTVYDPEIGDPDGGIQPGTAFEDIPDSWVCPVCGAAKSEFVKEG